MLCLLGILLSAHKTPFNNLTENKQKVIIFEVKITFETFFAKKVSFMI